MRRLLSAELTAQSYLIGLTFSLHTHASQIWQNAQGPASAPLSARPSGPGRRAIVNTAELLHKLVPMSGHRHQQSLGGQSTTSVGTSVANQQKWDAPQSRRTVSSAESRQPSATDSAQPRRDSGSRVNLPSGLTIDDFHRAVEVVAVAANALQEPAAPALGRRPSQASHLGGGSHARDASVAPAHTVVNAHAGHEASGGHDAPNWSRLKSASVLLACTALYAVIAEVLVDVVDVVLQGSAIPEKFLGVTLFALVPNVTECGCLSGLR